MKRISYILLLTLSVLLVTCRKYPELKVYKIDFINETVEKTASTARMTVEYSYPTKLESVNVMLSENSGLGGAISSAATITKKTFTAEFADLKSGTKYYYCYVYSNGMSLVKTDVKSFETSSASVPTVMTSSVTNITQTSAVGGGNVTSDGGAAVTVRGVCWSTSQNPTISDAHNANGSGTGIYEVNMPALTANTTYYVRAYATNSAGTSYGEQKSFTTSQSTTTPTVITNAVSNITQTSATCGGHVTSDGNATVTARGVCCSTSSNPTINNSHTTNGTGTGSFTSNITGLTSNTTYYVRAYATNTKGTSYGEQKSFTTNGSSGGHEYVNLGLPSGTLWAICNVGATYPEDYGDYFAWGETSPKSNYDWSTYQWCNGFKSTLTKYCTQSSYGYNGFVDNRTVLEPADDAAHVNWGGDWRMPTYDEMVELKSNCTWTWTTQGGKNGYKVTGSNSNSIFLPAAGYYGDGSLNYAGSGGEYWWSLLNADNPNCAYSLYFNSGEVCMSNSGGRCFGRSVRMVYAPQN